MGRAPAARSFDLARRVRSLRETAGLTLRELGQKSGISISALSKIERGQLSPTYEKIVALARGLQVDVDALFAGEPVRKVTGRRSITRRNEGVTYITKNYDYTMLCTELANKRMIPALGHVKAAEIKQFGPLLSHAGEELIFVVQGRVILHSEFYEPTELIAGDCAYYDSGMKHGFTLSGVEDAVLLWVCTSDEVQELFRSGTKLEKPDLSEENGIA